VFIPFREWSFHPLPDTIGITVAGQFALRIEEHNQHRAIGHMGLHHQAPACLIDETRFGKADLPARAPDQAIAVTEFPYAAACMD
jgi:hypothetical protein